MKVTFKTITVYTLMFIIVVFFSSCKKIPEGFLSDGVYYDDSPVKLDRGASLQITSNLKLDGSSLPAKIELLDIRNTATKKHADEFYKINDVYVYKEQIDPSTDTTLELVNRKRELRKVPMFQFLPSGQFLFNSGTSTLPVGATYEYDIRVTNASGTKEFKNIGFIQVIETDPFVVEGFGAAWFRDFDVSNTSGGLPAPKVTITKLADTGAYAILKITDQDGRPFNPRAGEIIKRGDRPTFESYAKFHPVTLTDSTLTCNFEINPFPLQTFGGFGHLIYYRIPSSFATITATLPGVEAPFTHSVNPRFAFLLKKTGTYLITVKVNGVSHK
jgi:hypothetical protein